jgi:hypothetical protein
MLALYSAHRALFVHGAVRMMVQGQKKTEITTEEKRADNGENIQPFAEAKNG